MATLIVIAFMLKLPLSSNETCRYILHFWRIRHQANTWDESIKILGTLPGLKVSIWPSQFVGLRQQQYSLGAASQAMRETGSAYSPAVTRRQLCSRSEEHTSELQSLM